MCCCLLGPPLFPAAPDSRGGDDHVAPNVNGGCDEPRNPDALDLAKIATFVTDDVDRVDEVVDGVDRGLASDPSPRADWRLSKNLRGRGERNGEP